MNEGAEGSTPNFRTEVTGKKLPSAAVCERYGITRRTLGRWMIDPELGFPKPTEINGRLYHNEALLDAWEIECARRAAAGKAEAAYGQRHDEAHTN
jgi:hypothetical protein